MSVPHPAQPAHGPTPVPAVSVRGSCPVASPTICRKLLPHEFPLYRAHLLRLDRNDRIARFDAGLSDQAVSAHCRKIAWPQTRIIGCFVGNELRGGAELQTLSRPDAPIDAELAVSVEGPFQGLGLGGALIRAGLLVARNRWLRRVGMLSAPGNRRLHRIVRRLGGVTTASDSGVETLFALARPDAASVLEEWAGDGTAILLWSLDSWVRAVAVRPAAR